MKKIMFGIAAIVLVAAGFAAVILVKLGNVPEGFNEIKRARGLYEKLDSARLVMKDASSGEVMMSFCFYINSDNEMILDYDDPRDDLHAYSDGKQYYYKSGGEWTAITPKDEEYIHNIYNRKYRYPYARGTVFFLDGTAVSEVTVAENSGGKTITYVYDCDRLNENSAKKLENVSAFSELTCVYTLDADGYLTQFAEKGSITDDAGITAEVDILLEVTDMNGVKSIDIPFD